MIVYQNQNIFTFFEIFWRSNFDLILFLSLQSFSFCISNFLCISPIIVNFVKTRIIMFRYTKGVECAIRKRLQVDWEFQIGISSSGYFKNCEFICVLSDYMHPFLKYSDGVLLIRSFHSSYKWSFVLYSTFTYISDHCDFC